MMDASSVMEKISPKPKHKKEIREMVHTKTHNNKHIVTHRHHHSDEHPDETHAFDSMDAVHGHMEAHAGTPNEGEQAPPDVSAGGPAQMTAAPSPMPGQ